MNRVSWQGNDRMDHARSAIEDHAVESHAVESHAVESHAVESHAVESHYGRGEILDSILRALREMGKDTDKLASRDLASVDEFHIRGREASVELADRAGLIPGLRVLDVGCGLGGSVRYLATERSCLATGIDLTGEYVETAAALAQRVGLANVSAFVRGSALELPFGPGSFDVVWTEHVQVNIADKQAFYAEIARVLAPGGRLAFHDIFRGGGGDLAYPVPWAGESAISFLAQAHTVREMLQGMGFTVRDWEDKTLQSLQWFEAAAKKLQASGPPPLGLHLLMGPTAKAKVANLIRNLAEKRIAVIQAVLEKT